MPNDMAECLLSAFLPLVYTNNSLFLCNRQIMFTTPILIFYSNQILLQNGKVHPLTIDCRLLLTFNIIPGGQYLFVNFTNAKISGSVQLVLIFGLLPTLITTSLVKAMVKLKIIILFFVLANCYFIPVLVSIVFQPAQYFFQSFCKSKDKSSET
jgi:hypothetical protein